MGGTFDYFWAPDEGVDVEDIRDLVPFAVERAPSADPQEIRRALASAVRRFLNDTGCWQKDVPCTVPEDGTVRVATRGCARVKAVSDVWLSSGVKPKTPSVSSWRTLVSNAREDSSGAFLIDIPSALTTDSWTAAVTLVTKLGSEVCPVWVLERYGEAIASQAAHTVAMKGQVGVTEMSLEFRAAVQEAIARRAVGGSSLSSGPGSAISDSIERI